MPSSFKALLGDESQLLEQALMHLARLPDDVTIITKENHEIKTNKRLLSVFSSLLEEILNVMDGQTIILLPQITASSVKQLLNIISTGLEAEEAIHPEENNLVLETAELIGLVKREKSIICQSNNQQSWNMEHIEEIEDIVKYEIDKELDS